MFKKHYRTASLDDCAKKIEKKQRMGYAEWMAFTAPDGWRRPIKEYAPGELKELRAFYLALEPKKREKLERNLTNSAQKWIHWEPRPRGLRAKKDKKLAKPMTLHHALTLLNACFSVNKNVKKWAYKREFEDDRDFEGWVHVDYTLRDKMYNQKTALIIAVIRGIRENRLPIKYGKNKGIVYFEYLGRQVSFHDPGNIIHCKPYAGVWCGRRNKRIPFEFNNKI